MSVENFKIYGFLITGQKIEKLRAKKFNVDIFTHAPPSKISPRFESSPSMEREITHPPGSVALKIYPSWLKLEGSKLCRVSKCKGIFFLSV